MVAKKKCIRVKKESIGINWLREAPNLQENSDILSVDIERRRKHNIWCIVRNNQTPVKESDY